MKALIALIAVIAITSTATAQDKNYHFTEQRVVTAASFAAVTHSLMWSLADDKNHAIRYSTGAATYIVLDAIFNTEEKSTVTSFAILGSSWIATTLVSSVITGWDDAGAWSNFFGVTNGMIITYTIRF